MLYLNRFAVLRTPIHSLKMLFNDTNINSKSSLFKEGLYLASKDFFNQYYNQDNDNKPNTEKQNMSFFKYWLRSCTRCTPYGTFAGCLLSDVNDLSSAIILSDESMHFRNVRLDMNFITELIRSLEKVSAVESNIRLFPNNTLYEMQSEWRYIEYSISNSTRNYHSTAIEKTSYIKLILDSARNGASIRDLSDILIREEAVSLPEANSFIKELWNAQVLVSELEPCVTGEEPITHLLSQIITFQGIDTIKERLNYIQTLLNDNINDVLIYQEIEAEIKELIKIILKESNQEFLVDESRNTIEEKGADIKIPRDTIQVDLFLSGKEQHLNKQLLESCLNSVNDLFFLAQKYENGDLNRFKNQFAARYEGEEIPLPIALDADLGIGYAGIGDQNSGGAEYINGLPIALKRPEPGIHFNYIQEYALRKYEDYIRNNKPYIEIQETELKSFKKHIESFRFPRSISLFGSLLKKNGKLDEKHYVLDITSVGGASSANLLGRFTQGNKQMEDFVQELLAADEKENPEVIYAEIVHLPQARTGNILLRPLLRKYEIPYSGKSGAKMENQIPVDDLLISVQGKEIILRSKKYNKRVIPRLTTAHNYSQGSLPVYKFLCDLQMQGFAWPNVWDWGHLNTLKHLPRVIYKNLILQKAIWKVEEKEINNLPDDKKSYIEFFGLFRNKLQLPQRVVYKEGDNELLIDFNEIRCIDLFLHYLKRHKTIVLEEFLFTEENCIIHDKDGLPYTNEIIIPLTYKKDNQDQNENIYAIKERVSNTLSFPAEWESHIVPRKFSVGSEWLYFKVYAGAKTAERILSKVILPFVEEGRALKMFSMFFFVRYQDESGGHFRIRFYNKGLDSQYIVQKEFIKRLKPLVDNRSINNIIIDSYVRELERYHPLLIEEAETLFYNDSLLVLRLLELFNEIVDPNQYRMLFALRGIDMLLNDFGCSLEEKHNLLNDMFSNYFIEFGASPALKKQLNNQYRKYKGLIESHMDINKDRENAINEAIELINLRSEMNKPVIESIYSKLGTEDRKILSQLLPSYLHMFLNRLFIAQQRKYELAVYTFLERYYASLMAITKQKAIAQVKPVNLQKSSQFTS